MAFTRTMGEFDATMMFAGNIPGQTQTMSTAIYATVQANYYYLAFQQAILLVILSMIFMVVVNLVTNKK